MVTRVKICGITNEDDLVLAASEGADAVGLVMEPTSPRCIAHAHVDILAALAGPYCATVAVYGRYRGPLPPTDAVQAVHFESVAPLSILAVRIRDGMDPATVAELGTGHRALVLDADVEGTYGGTGKKIDWGFAAEIVRLARVPVVLAGGLSPDNVADAVSQVHPYAVDVSSGVESSVGRKDPHKVRDFIAAARSAG